MASVDQPDDNRRFAEEHEANFPILSDPTKEMSAAYGVLSARGFDNRWTFYIDASGTIQRIDKKVNPATAGQALVMHLEELRFPKKAM
jgi:peroxiredoxin Q/BCP